jgi:hypothetical protein
MAKSGFAKLAEMVGESIVRQMEAEEKAIIDSYDNNQTALFVMAEKIFREKINTKGSGIYLKFYTSTMQFDKRKKPEPINPWCAEASGYYFKNGTRVDVVVKGNKLGETPEAALIFLIEALKKWEI